MKRIGFSSFRRIRRGPLLFAVSRPASSRIRFAEIAGGPLCDGKALVHYDWWLFRHRRRRCGRDAESPVPLCRSCGGRPEPSIGHTTGEAGASVLWCLIFSITNGARGPPQPPSIVVRQSPATERIPGTRALCRYENRSGIFRVSPKESRCQRLPKEIPDAGYP